ncbi:MAG: 3-deoxy-manno-octulosonate cytidylyltransferase, partial [Alphaproteobacteria bacterium]|nr:3-deoxy-manno-octulosonate cytidylyltransferase [Alphaproteobacteria bacterium]
MKAAIIIPARYASTRFPGKPLALIGGQTMLSRVVAIANRAAAAHPGTAVMVATEDQRIMDYCATINAPCVMTPDDCPTGSDRVLAAAKLSGEQYDVLFSLQGDAPFTPLPAISAMLAAFATNPQHEVVTPVVRLRWPELDALRDSKKTTPFSGTTAVIDSTGRALWFSKNILPAIRKEDGLRKDEFSPVHQHLGLYAYRTDILERFVNLPQGYY